MAFLGSIRDEHFAKGRSGFFFLEINFSHELNIASESALGVCHL